MQRIAPPYLLMSFDAQVRYREPALSEPSAGGDYRFRSAKLTRGAASRAHALPLPRTASEGVAASHHLSSRPKQLNSHCHPDRSNSTPTVIPTEATQLPLSSRPKRGTSEVEGSHAAEHHNVCPFNSVTRIRQRRDLSRAAA